MKIYFYCSYNLSPLGYQDVTLDPETGVQNRCPVGVKAIKTLLTHGGAKTVLGFDGNVFYLVLKGMRAEKPDVPANTPGQTWYMNLALSASADDLEDLCAAAYYGYTNYQEFMRRLAACLTPREEETSYVIDSDGWRELMEEASVRYRRFLDNGEPDFSDAPFGLDVKQMKEAFDILYERKITDLYEFVLLEGEVNYFLSSCGGSLSQLRHYVKANGERPKEIKYSVGPKTTKDEKDIVPMFLGVGAAIGLSLLAAYQIGKALGSAKHRRRGRR